MRRAPAILLLAPCLAAAQPCAPGPGSAQLDSSRYTVALRTAPDPVAVGKHFALELAVCPKSGAKPPENVRVDAHMPEHRHGMNYTAEVIPGPGGTYRAQGLMFHMPGHWEILLDLRSGGETDRLVRSMSIE